MLSIEDRAYIEKFYPERYSDDLYWGFTQFSRENYTNAVNLDAKDEVIYGIYSTDGSVLAEMAMRWYRINNENVPRIECFLDAFLLLKSPMLQILFEKLQNVPENLSPEDFSRLLLSMGFCDKSDKSLDE